MIAADGGARHAAALKLSPDWIVGDFDSIPAGMAGRWPKARLARDMDEHRSDLDKALSLAKRLGASRVVAAGALGLALDHALVNLAVLESSKLDVELLDEGSAKLLGPGRHRPRLPKGARFSLLAAPRARVRLTGARWPLKGEPLPRGSRGLGNRAVGAVTLHVLSGRVWLAAA